jgi:hypothetical protein
MVVSSILPIAIRNLRETRGHDVLVFFDVLIFF